MPNAEFSAMAIAAPTLQFRQQIVTPLIRRDVLNLTMLRGFAIADLVENAPRVTSAPDRIERALAGADGKTYFVPQARIAVRSLATPDVFLAKDNGVVTLQVWFDLVRFPSLPTDSVALPVDNFSVSLVAASGDPIVFERCDDLPRGDRPEEVLSRLYCETPVDANAVVPMLQSLGTRFRVEGDVHFTTQDAAPAAPSPGGVRVRPTGRLRVFETPGRTFRLADVTTLSAVSNLSAAVSPIIRDHRVIATPTVGGPAPAAPEPQWSSHTTRLSLGAADNSGVAACFPPDVMDNRAIYAQVTTGFGSEPWSEWVDSPNGQFMASPLPGQFYVVPDEYRLAFDAETKQPAMMVLLVPPKRAEGDASPTTFGADYKLRTRFSVVPWIDPARRERLRAEIVKNTTIAYPDLLVGGIREATCELSAVLHELGSSLVGTDGGASQVDGVGFDLVLDCTSEFYNTLTHLLVTDGVDAAVTATLISDDEHPRVVTVPVTLRLDRPATDVLSATLVPAAAPPAVEAPDGGAPDGAAPDEGEPAPAGPPILRVSNPLPYAVTVSEIVASLLVADERVPRPIAAVPATAEPSSFQLPAATDAPAVLDIVLTPAPSDQPALFGSVGVSFLGIEIDIDPQQVLAKAYDTGTTGSVSSAVEVRSYQLEHPESRPAALADVFGLEVEIRRSADAAPVTVFLTTDQPKLEVQVSFSLSEIVAGARPEQPTFEWRRRNMSGSGNGEWSEWSSITGRQLFVSPAGM